MKYAILASLLLTACGPAPAVSDFAISNRTTSDAEPGTEPSPEPSASPAPTCPGGLTLVMSQQSVPYPFCLQPTPQPARGYIVNDDACGPSGRMCKLPETMGAYRDGLLGHDVIWTYSQFFDRADPSSQSTGAFNGADGTYSIVNIRQTNFNLKSHCCYPTEGETW